MAPLITNKPVWKQNTTLRDAFHSSDQTAQAVQAAVSQNAPLLRLWQPCLTLPTSLTLKWPDRFVRPPPYTAGICDISTRAAGRAPGLVPVWLSGHLGSRRCSGAVQPANLGCWKGLPREDTMDWQWSRSPAQRARSTMDKWSIKPLVTGSDPLIEFPATEKAAGRFCCVRLRQFKPSVTSNKPFVDDEKF